MLASSPYYAHVRPELIALVPDDVMNLVDVGCGAGGTCGALKSTRPGLVVRGVELMPEPAALARKLLDEVVCGSAEAPMPDHWPAPDCLIFGDVLEHLVDPWSVLNDWVGRLKPGGTVVASIPNVGHQSVLSPLIRGHWRYQDEGVLDRTHLRFFTRETALGLLAHANLNIIRLDRIVNKPMGGAFGNLILAWARRKVRREPLQGYRPGFGRFLLDYCTVQFLFVARKQG